MGTIPVNLVLSGVDVGRLPVKLEEEYDLGPDLNFAKINHHKKYFFSRFSEKADEAWPSEWVLTMVRPKLLPKRHPPPLP